jgi:hypothetical protein
MRQMALTDYHAKTFAYELKRRYPSDSVEKLASALVDAQVDLNPHQVDAALFAFRSPLSFSPDSRRAGTPPGSDARRGIAGPLPEFPPPHRHPRLHFVHQYN